MERRCNAAIQPAHRVVAHVVTETEALARVPALPRFRGKVPPPGKAEARLQKRSFDAIQSLHLAPVTLLPADAHAADARAIFRSFMLETMCWTSHYCPHDELR